MTEEIDEVQEKLNTVPDVVVVSMEMFLHNQLCIEEDEEGKDSGTSVQGEVEQGRGTEEHVEDGSEEQHRETAAEDTTKEEVGSTLRPQCTQ